MQYCSLQHQTLLLSPVTSTAGYCFCFGSIPLFFLELFLHWSQVAYWAPTDLGSSSFSILSLCLLILFMGFSRQEYWGGLPFPSPVDHMVSDLSTMPAHLGWPHRAWLSFTELDKAVVWVIRLTSFLWLWFQCVCPPMPSPNTYHLTWVSLTLDWGISSRLLQKSTATASYLGRGVSPQGCPSWPWMWNSSTHGHHQMVNIDIRLILFFAAKDGEALYSQQKQDQELIVPQILNSLLPNSERNWRK